MGGGFRVEPTYVAGYRELLRDTASDCSRLASFVRSNAKSDSYFSGVVMGNLAGLVDGYATATSERIRDRRSALSHTSTELRNTAWEYVDADNWTARMWTYDPARGGVVEADFPDGGVEFDHVDVVGQLDAPAIDEDGGSDYVMQDAGHDLTTLVEITEFINNVVDTGFDPIREVTDRITGNWNSLTQKGEVLTIAGDAAETAADNLTGGLPKLFGEWEGGAADSFEAYISDLEAALRYEGPLNRVVGQVYMVVADVIKEAARVAIRLIGELISRIRAYLTSTGLLELGAEITWDAISNAWDALSSWPPWEGWDDPLDAFRNEWNSMRQLYDDAVAMIDTLLHLHEDIEAVIEVAQDPLAALEGRLREVLEEELEPISDRVDEVNDQMEEIEEIQGQVQDALDFGQDIVDLTDTDALADAPDEGFDAGEDIRRE